MSKAKDRLYESLGGGRKALDRLGYNAENGLTSKGNEPGRKKISEKAHDNEMRRTLTNGIAESQYARNGNYSSSRKAANAGEKAGNKVVRGVGSSDRTNARTIKMYDRAFGETSGKARADQTKAHEEEKKRAAAAAAAARGNRR